MRQGSAAAVTVAQWAGYFRDPELALQALQADDDPQHRTVIALTSWWPSMAAARRLPAFKELVKKIGLVDYWREFGWGEHCRPLSDTDFECR
jgi:hypothetical protein